jgi:hypothetical protein
MQRPPSLREGDEARCAEPAHHISFPTGGNRHAREHHPCAVRDASGHRRRAGLGQAGIRLHDAICGVLIYGNVFCRSSRNLFGGVQIHGGKENIVENNVFVDCLHGISFSGWGPERWKQVIEGPGITRKAHEEVDITRPPYSTRYPQLAHLLDNEGVNMVWRNVAYNCGDFLTRDRGIQDLMANYVTVQDPGFVDAGKLDFALKPDSPILAGGAFRPIPFEEIGPYGDR